MPVQISGIGALGALSLKLRALSTIFWKAVTYEQRTRTVKNGNKSFQQPYVDKNSWYRDGDLIDPVTGRKVTFREAMTGAEDPNNVAHTFVVTYPIVITDGAGVARTKLFTFSLKVSGQKDLEITGDHVRQVVIQGVSDYLGTITAGEPATEGFTRIINGSQYKP